MSVRLKRLEKLADELPPVGDTLFAQFRSIRTETRRAAWLRTLTDEQLKDLLRQEVQGWSASEEEKKAIIDWLFSGNPEDVLAALKASIEQE